MKPFTIVRSKLECFPPANFPVKPCAHPDALKSVFGRLLAIPTNIRLGWKGLPRTNTLAYY